MNTGMGSLSLLQWIFLTQESNVRAYLHVDSLPDELSERLQIVYITHNNSTVVTWRTSCISSVMLLDSINKDSYRL